MLRETPQPQPGGIHSENEQGSPPGPPSNTDRETHTHQSDSGIPEQSGPDNLLGNSVPDANKHLVSGNIFTFRRSDRVQTRNHGSKRPIDLTQERDAQGEGRSRKSKYISMQRVAERAGVSRTTVSYVVSGKRYVSIDATRRVIRAMKELDYQTGRHSQRITARDVAQQAGVSLMTVSRALRNTGDPVSDATRARVLSAASDLGYQLGPRRPSRRRRLPSEEAPHAPMDLGRSPI